MNVARPPIAPLRPFIRRVWWSDPRGGVVASPGAREHVLPTGAMHVVVHLDDAPLRLFAPGGAALEFPAAVIGGARSAFYVKDVASPSRSVGAMLEPGTAWPLLGAPAEAFAERHTALEDVWGARARELRDRLRDARGPEDALAVFEGALAAGLPRVRGVHPLVAFALARLGAGCDVAGVVEATGYSHRRFVTVFTDATGLPPKRYARVARFQRALAGVGGRASLTELAVAAGYADQAHLTREFREMAGVSPGAYRRLAPAFEHHVPVDGSDSFKTGARGRGRVGA